MDPGDAARHALGDDESLAARWRRRALTIPGYGLATGLWLTLLPLTLPLALVVDLVRGGPRWGTFTRTVLFFAVYLACESVGLVVAGWLWLRHLGGHGPRRAAFLRDNFRLQCRWTSALFLGGARLYGWRIGVEGEDEVEAAARSGRPVLVFVRHASTADTVLCAHLVASRHDVLLRYVMKSQLLADPCLDVVGQRLPNVFARRLAGQTDRNVARIRAMSTGLGAGDGVLFYPEGSRFSPAKRDAMLADVERSGRADLLERSRALTHVLPPRLAGALALFDVNAAAEHPADVLFCAHTGLEGARSFDRFLKGGLVGIDLRVRFWRVSHSEIPEGREERVAWLYDQWERVDAFVREHEARG